MRRRSRRKGTEPRPIGKRLRTPNCFTIEKVLTDRAYGIYDCWNGMEERKMEFVANVMDNSGPTMKSEAQREYVLFIRAAKRRRAMKERNIRCMKSRNDFFIPREAFRRISEGKNRRTVEQRSHSKDGIVQFV
jgi:hypothetical protein